MGLFDFLGKNKRSRYTPDFCKSEYANWIVYIDSGGSTSEWERLKKENNWFFPKDEVDILLCYENEVKQVADKYYTQLQKIQKEWSVLYNLGDYTSDLANKLEADCISNITDYKAMRKIDQKYGVKTAINIPAFKRLAMLYEKQGRFVEAIEVCKQAYSFGMDERSRMVRMIKKAGRTPTLEEQKLLFHE